MIIAFQFVVTVSRVPIQQGVQRRGQDSCPQNNHHDYSL